ncbi:hypothetical protein BT63DRAFT_412466 [Microthyrium microscopicum]|uniref:Uncharacterized protein n=1 Tax=Microthyrium microscopicum TaxID=703497 RepID=A0A6A6UKL7_9PEZI|nr:hypothetical protein BT63DRAFT_412466 [Microthyrium microscopicum]
MISEGTAACSAPVLSSFGTRAFFPNLSTHRLLVLPQLLIGCDHAAFILQLQSAERARISMHLNHVGQSAERDSRSSWQDLSHGLRWRIALPSGFEGTCDSHKARALEKSLRYKYSYWKSERHIQIGNTEFSGNIKIELVGIYRDNLPNLPLNRSQGRDSRRLYFLPVHIAYSPSRPPKYGQDYPYTALQFFPGLCEAFYQVSKTGAANRQITLNIKLNENSHDRK